MTSLDKEPFKAFDVDVKSDALGRSISIHGVHARCATNPNVPAILLLHGFPQDFHICTRHLIAPKLLERHHVVATNLRGYGQHGDKPSRGKQDENYSKREMAHDQVQVMTALGYERFYVLAHDRGARVAHRLVLDHPHRVLKLIVLDIAPTVHMYNSTNVVFAQKYWHWFLFIQPHPLPERLLQSAPDQFVQNALLGAYDGFDPSALQSYTSMALLPGCVEAMMADYRASAPGGIDATLDQSDQERGHCIAVPMMCLYGTRGIIPLMEPDQAWTRVCEPGMYCGGLGVDSGHYIPEEAPDVVLEHVFAFFV